MKPSRGLLAPFGSALAFTLIELLVVIAIIAILASMLLPGLARAQESARSVLCNNNLHEMSVAAMHYSMDQNNRFPNFRSWLEKTNADLRSGELFKYVGAKETYLCPTDQRELSSKSRPKWATGLPPPAAGPSIQGKRDYSYVMSCGMCHAIDTSLYKSPPQTVLFMEAYLATNDYSGMVGPRLATHSLALRHGRKGNLVMTDLHIEHLTQKKADEAEQFKIFWFPTDNTSGPGGGGDMAVGLK
jgi:prepilin-type N-terminal cleavage/methylation domain-containing protein